MTAVITLPSVWVLIQVCFVANKEGKIINSKNYRVISVQTISRKYLKPKSPSDTKLLNTVLLRKFIHYYSNDIPVKVLRVSKTLPCSLLILKIAYTDWHTQYMWSKVTGKFILPFYLIGPVFCIFADKYLLWLPF